MNIIVPVKIVPDLVEELEIDDTGARLDTTYLRLMLNEFDEHAIEQAILLKEQSGGSVTVIAPDVDGADDALFSAAAKGADRLIMFECDNNNRVNNHALAREYRSLIADLSPDLVLTGVQAHDDLDGSVGPLLAGFMNLPYVGYIAGVVLENGSCIVRKEYPGGLVAEMEVQLPAVLGIQAASEAPRYVPISKVRQAMKTQEIEMLSAGELDPTGAAEVTRIFPPEIGERATILEGDEAEVAEKMVEILRDIGVVS